jgi:hypothetical protein
LTADNEFHIKIENGIINPECWKQCIVSATTIVPGLLWPIPTPNI